MAQSDLYSLLKGYTIKIKSPSIVIKDFLVFIEKYAQQMPPDQVEWKNWSKNASANFWAEIPELAEKGKCVLITDNKGEHIFLPSYCQMLIKEAYKNIDKLSATPFPSEESLGIKIPKNNVRTISLVSDMKMFFEQSDETPGSDEIILLKFPQDFESAILLGSFVPRKIMEISLLKIRYFLNRHNNKEYVQNKLTIQIPGKEKATKEIIEKITIRPMDCLSEMEMSADFPYMFWTYFCSLIKNSIRKKNDLLAEDMSIIQAVCIIEVCCSFYRTAVSKKRDVEIAFKTLDVLMDRSPWNYTLDDITSFTNDRGIPLLDIYSRKELEEYINKAISEKNENDLPAWLVIHGMNNIRWFVKKERYLHICNKMLNEAQPHIRAAIIKRWTKLLADFSSESAIENDADFEKLIENQLKAYNASLLTILYDPKLHMTFEELHKIPGALHQASRIFKDNELLPFSVLLSLRRKDLLYDIKVSFPFWHSIPVIRSILAFFRKLKKEKKKKKKDTVFSHSEMSLTELEPGELSRSARLLESALVPQGKTLDEYLEDLEGRWSRILDPKARKDLILDVQALLKDNIRQAMKVYKLKKINREGLHEMSGFLLRRNSNLSKLKDQDSLRLYMELFMLKLLIKWKG